MNKFISFLILFLPSKVKILVLKLLFGRNSVSSDAYIGFSYINAKKVKIGKDVYIGNFNLINNVEELLLSNGSKIITRNIIRSVNKFIMDEETKVGISNHFYCNPLLNKKSIFKLGHASAVTSYHSFDLTDDIFIGNQSVIAGKGTQFWTHSFDIKRNRLQRKIKIGDNVYLGSMSVVLSNICDNVQIGAGSVIYKDINKSGFWSTHSLNFLGEIKNIPDRKDVEFYELNGHTFWIQRKN